MSEYIHRAAGGFYIVDDDRPRTKVLAVRRAVHQVIDPKTGHPFPELSIEEQYSRSLLDPPVKCSYSNALPTYVDLTEEGISRIGADLMASLAGALLDE